MAETIVENLIDTLDALAGKAFKLGADAADAMLVESSDLSVSRRMGRPETLELSESKMLGLRVFKGKKQAIVSTSDFSEEALNELAERAVSMAGFVPADEFSGLAEPELLAREIKELSICDSSEISADELTNLVAEMEDAALATKGITNSDGADGGYSRSRVYLYASNGFAGSYESTSYSISLAVLAGSGDRMERDYDYTVARFLSKMKAPANVGYEAARRTLAKLDSRKVKTTTAPVVFEPRVARSLVGQLASAISGSAVARKTSFLQEKLGKQIFASGINIIDDPHIPSGLASKPFDGEGVLGRKRNIIENGILTSWLMDVRSANQLGFKSTGHASRSVASNPFPSATNFYMEAGKASPEELIADIKEGFYVTETFGMGINPVTGDYSQGAAGFWIENGKIGYPVSEVTIASNLIDMFLGITPANDLIFESRVNSPTLRLDKMTIAGS